MSRAEPFGRQSFYVLSLSRGVDDSWVLTNDFDFRLALHSAGDISTDGLNPLDYSLLGAFVIGAHGAHHERRVRVDVMRVPSCQMTDTEYAVLPAVCVA